ncbi:MAG: ComEC/Rec2 family competence protein [Selenomonas sp.]|nr:ComEC/Rec2 family competence protein [Selenomonas sp.]
MKIGQGQELFLAGLLIALGAGIGCASLLTLPGSITLPLLLLALSLSIFGAWQGRQWTWMAVLAAFFCVGMLRFMAADYLSEQDISNFARETVKVEGILRERGVNSFVAAGLSITLAAQLATLPVLAWYFNQLSLSSLLANLVVVPLVELLIVLGLFAGVLAFALPFVGSVVFACDSLLLGVVEELTAQMAALPASAIWIPSLHFSGGLLYYVLLGLFLLTAEQREKLWEGLKARRKVLGTGALVLFVFVVSWQLARPKEMQVHFIDVCR